MKSFTTGEHVQDHLDGGPITFEHDGREVTAHPPTVTQYALFMAAWEALDQDLRPVADIVDFFFCLWDKPDYDYFRDRLWDRADPFDLHGKGGLLDLLGSVLEVWTRSPSAQALSH